MLTDVFFRRYADLNLVTFIDERVKTLLFQFRELVMTDLWLASDNQIRNERAIAVETAAKRVAFEIGKKELVPYYEKRPAGVGRYSTHHRGWETIVKEFVQKSPGPQEAPAQWFAIRISLLEQIIRTYVEFKEEFDASYEDRLSTAELEDAVRQQRHVLFLPHQTAPGLRVDKVWSDGRLDHITQELNERFRIARLPLEYHNGIIQKVVDPLVSAQVVGPFWQLLTDPKWANVDTHMKQSLHERDLKIADAHFPALQALESTIKIISDEKGWTLGTEKGAANYINNLVKDRGGVRFIEVWENDMLIQLFGKVRNPHGHGPGAQPLAKLSREQEEWAIETAMVWIKSLVKRL